jgi:mannose-6-phosphate isomerase-like protein (cupin superfamily)
LSYAVVNIEEIEGSGPGGVVRFVRREVGAEAFGINWFDLPANQTGMEHDEVETGQEEVYVVVKGSGHWHIDGAVVQVRAGSVIRIDPETARCPVAGEDGMSFISVGARRGSYEPHGPF